MQVMRATSRSVTLKRYVAVPRARQLVQVTATVNDALADAFARRTGHTVSVSFSEAREGSCSEMEVNGADFDQQ